MTTFPCSDMDVTKWLIPLTLNSAPLNDHRPWPEVSTLPLLGNWLSFRCSELEIKKSLWKKGMVHVGPELLTGLWDRPSMLEIYCFKKDHRRLDNSIFKFLKTHFLKWVFKLIFKTQFVPQRKGRKEIEEEKEQRLGNQSAALGQRAQRKYIWVHVIDPCLGFASEVGEGLGFCPKDHDCVFMTKTNKIIGTCGAQVKPYFPAA